MFVYHNKCQNADRFLIKRYNDRDYSKLECDKLCVGNDQCKAFMWGTRGQISGDCELYRDELKNCNPTYNYPYAYYHPSNHRTHNGRYNRPDVCPLGSYVYYGRAYDSKDNKNKKKLTWEEMIKHPYERSLVADTWTNGCNARNLGISEFDTQYRK